MNRAVWMAALIAGCAGISTQLDSNSEGDEVRDQATGLFLDNTRTDSIDGDEGDNTDWSYIDIIDPGGLQISVGFDNPERLKGAHVSLFDGFGKRLDRRLIVPNTTSYLFKRDVEKPDKFYVMVFTQEGKSVYSLGARLALDPSAKPTRVVPVRAQDPEPEAESPAAACPEGMVSSGGSCKCPRGTYQAGDRCKRRVTPRSTVVAPKTDAPVAPATTAPAVVETPRVVSTGRVIGGAIQRVLPSADGQSVTVFISLDAPGVKVGDVGQLYKGGAAVRGGTVKVTKAAGKAAKGFVPVPSSDLGTGGLTVKITTK